MKKITKFLVFVAIMVFGMFSFVSAQSVVVKTLSATNINDTSAILNAKVGSFSNITEYRLYWSTGTITSDSQYIVVNESDVHEDFNGGFSEEDILHASKNLSGLLPNTTYHYNIWLVNKNGTFNVPISMGIDQTFKTLPTQNIFKPVSDITGDSATVNFQLPGNVVGLNLNLYKSNDLSTPIKIVDLFAGEIDLNFKGTHKFTNLVQDTQYTVIATGTGNILYGNNNRISFTTNRVDYSLTITLNGQHPAGSSVQASINGANIANGNCSAQNDESTNCTIQINQNEKVTLTQSSASDALFTWWQGDCTGSHDSCEFTMDSNKNVSAEFNKINIIPSSNDPTKLNPNQKPVNSNGATYKVNLDSENGGLVPCGIIRKETKDANGNTVLGEIERPCNFDYFIVLLNNLVRWILFYLAIPLAAIMFAYAGFLMLFSGGEATKKKKAIHIFTGVAIGLVIVAAAWIIVHTLLIILGVNSVYNWFGLA